MKDFKEMVLPHAKEPLTKQLLTNLLKEYKRPYDKIHELVSKGELTPVKRGIYITRPNVKIERPTLFLLANHLLGPFYVSLDSALAYWGLIPERVYETSSICLKESKDYQTPVGKFSYSKISLPFYAFGIKRIQLTKRQSVLLASPEKALCDKVIMTSGLILRSARQTISFLTEDLRMEPEALRTLRISEIEAWISEAPKSTSLAILLKTIRSL